MAAQNYWQERYLKDKARSINLSERYIKGRLKTYYTEAEKEIEAEIENFYEKYAKDEELTLAEARKRISSAEFSRSKFEKMAKETAALKKKYGKDIPEGIKKQIEEQERILNTLSKKSAITRLQGLQANIDNAILKLYDKQQITMYDMLKNGYEDGYYRGIFRIQQQMGIGTDFTAVNERAVRQAVTADHGKGNFSSRLYKHSKTLSKDLQENLTVGLIRGESVDTMAKRISRRLDVSMSNAKRLVRTETAYIHELATMESYKEAGIEKYRFLATLDNKTSEMCQELDRKEFPVDKATPGENLPPMHPNCRSTTEAVFEDELESVRTARNADGNQYMVPRDMSYKEWKEKYVPMENIDTNDSLHTYAETDIIEMAQSVADILGTYGIARTNKWSGKIVFDNADVQYGKLWNCDIATQLETEPYILMHEMLHAHSVSYFTPKEYIAYATIEEASVEYVNMLIASREKIAIVDSVYGENVQKLRKIYSMLDGYDNEMDFALDLFNQAMPDRINWLTTKVNETILKVTDFEKMEEYQELFDLIDELK